VALSNGRPVVVSKHLVMH